MNFENTYSIIIKRYIEDLCTILKALLVFFQQFNIVVSFGPALKKGHLLHLLRLLFRLNWVLFGQLMFALTWCKIQT